MSANSEPTASTETMGSSIEQRISGEGSSNSRSGLALPGVEAQSASATFDMTSHSSTSSQYSYSEGESSSSSRGRYRPRRRRANPNGGKSNLDKPIPEGEILAGTDDLEDLQLQIAQTEAELARAAAQEKLMALRRQARYSQQESETGSESGQSGSSGRSRSQLHFRENYHKRVQTTRAERSAASGIHAGTQLVPIATHPGPNGSQQLTPKPEVTPNREGHDGGEGTDWFQAELSHIMDSSVTREMDAQGQARPQVEEYVISSPIGSEQVVTVTAPDGPDTLISLESFLEDVGPQPLQQIMSGSTGKDRENPIPLNAPSSQMVPSRGDGNPAQFKPAQTGSDPAVDNKGTLSTGVLRDAPMALVPASPLQPDPQHELNLVQNPHVPMGAPIAPGASGSLHTGDLRGASLALVPAAPLQSDSRSGHVQHFMGMAPKSAINNEQNTGAHNALEMTTPGKGTRYLSDPMGSGTAHPSPESVAFPDAKRQRASGSDMLVEETVQNNMSMDIAQNSGISSLGEHSPGNHAGVSGDVPMADSEFPINGQTGHAAQAPVAGSSGGPPSDHVVQQCRAEVNSARKFWETQAQECTAEIGEQARQEIRAELSQQREHLEGISQGRVLSARLALERQVAAEQDLRARGERALEHVMAQASHHDGELRSAGTQLLQQLADSQGEMIAYRDHVAAEARARDEGHAQITRQFMATQSAAQLQAQEIEALRQALRHSQEALADRWATASTCSTSLPELALTSTVPNRPVLERHRHRAV